MENYSKPTIANFGRSLFGGYCPTYVPDFVLHGVPSDEKLRQSLMSELNHAVQVNIKKIYCFHKSVQMFFLKNRDNKLSQKLL